MTKRDESNFLVSPSINQSQNRTLQFNQSDIQKPWLPFRFEPVGEFLLAFVNQVSNPEVEPVLRRLASWLDSLLHWC